MLGTDKGWTDGSGDLAGDNFADPLDAPCTSEAYSISLEQKDAINVINHVNALQEVPGDITRTG